MWSLGLDQLSTNCQRISISLPSSSSRLTNQMTKAYMNNSNLQALLLRCTLYITQLKTRWLPKFPQVMGPGLQNLFFFFFFFYGNESKYELWEVKSLGYLRIQHLHQIILSPTDQSDDMDLVERMLLSSPSSFSI